MKGHLSGKSTSGTTCSIKQTSGWLLLIWSVIIQEKDIRNNLFHSANFKVITANMKCHRSGKTFGACFIELTAQWSPLMWRVIIQVKEIMTKVFHSASLKVTTVDVQNHILTLAFNDNPLLRKRNPKQSVSFSWSQDDTGHVLGHIRVTSNNYTVGRSNAGQEQIKLVELTKITAINISTSTSSVMETIEETVLFWAARIWT